jgi:hypothetical protein
VKAQGRIAASDTTRDSQITSLIAGVQDLVKRWLGRDIEQTTYTEYYTGNNSPYLILRQYPVVSITSICIDSGGYNGDAPNAFPASQNLTQGVDFTLTCGLAGQGANGIVRRINNVWYGRPSRALGTVENLPPLEGTGNIKVVYVAGYSPVPPSIQMAVNDLILKKTITSVAGGAVTQMAYEDGSVSFFSPEEEAKLFGSISQTLGVWRDLPC